MEEGGRWRNAREAHDARFDSVRLDSNLPSPHRSQERSVLYHGLASVQNHHDSMAGVFRVLGEKRKEKG